MNLKDYRTKIGKTQAECSKELDITVVYYSDLERGVFKPSPQLAMQIETWSQGNIPKSELRPDIWQKAA